MYHQRIETAHWGKDILLLCDWNQKGPLNMSTAAYGTRDIRLEGAGRGSLALQNLIVKPLQI